MFSRREIKKKAIRSLKKHYLLFVFICLMGGFLGAASGGGSLQISQESRAGAHESALTDNAKTGVAGGAFTLANGSSAQKLLDAAGELMQEGLSRAGLDPRKVLGRSRGVLASLINTVSSGTLLATLVSGIVSFTGSESAALALMIVLGLVLALFVWFYLTNTYTAAAARLFLEGRTYEEVPVSRFLFFARVKKWTNVARVMLLTTVFQILWGLTVAGGIVKFYSYRMVPYIAAENPSVEPLEAIRLSRRMMRGHKWECFKLDLSFFGWTILNLLTFGLSGILFSNPYREAAFGEYYAHLRALAKEGGVEGSESLNDRYLFEQADAGALSGAYEKEIGILEKQGVPEAAQNVLLRFAAKYFGVILRMDRREQEYEAYMAEKSACAALRREMSGRAYPGRLSPLPEMKQHDHFHNLYYERRYSVWSIIMLYFIFAVIGWLWEVSLHLVTNGEFVNRGVLHGPWLPIYGTGGVLILLILYRFRNRPALEFFTTIVLCGCVEYFTAWYLEATHGGQKWWDYSGYFLNLHGRICAEGLLVFGLGGMAIVYLAAPLLDNLIRRISRRVLIPVCAVLLILYCADQLYSSDHPNTGKGITDYARQVLILDKT